MKTFTCFLVLSLMSFCCFSQSKKELLAKNQKLNEEILTLKSANLKLQEEIIAVKELNLSLNTDITNCKTVNQRLQAALESHEASHSSTPIIPTTSSNSQTTATQRCKAITAKGTQCTRNAEPGSDYCWQHKSTYEPNSTSNKASSSTYKAPSSSSSGRTIYTGPRGGRYYINSKGNKTYIKK